jgi:2Fe-2S ferredoxin
MPRLIFIERDGSRRELSVPAGMSVMEAARDNGVDIEGACEGSLACATCHVVVDPEWFQRLPPAQADEEDMLDLAFGVAKTSRLGCQIVMSDALDGLTVRLPKEVRNLLEA